MEIKQLLGIIGGILLCLGVFMPFVGNPLVQASYMKVTEWEGYFVLITGLLIFFIAAANELRFIAIPSILTLIPLTYTFINYFVAQESSTAFEKELRSLQWGAGILIAGAMFSLASGLTKKNEKTKKENKA